MTEKGADGCGPVVVHHFQAEESPNLTTSGMTAEGLTEAVPARSGAHLRMRKPVMW